MKSNFLARKIAIVCLAALFLFSDTAWAYWVWTPGTKKFINPKNAVKDSPKEQFEWAMTFYNAKDYVKAASEFDKLTKQYEYSEYASKAQYYVGLCYENMNKFYLAFQNYQKAIDNFPHIENMDEIVAREFNIAGLFVTKESPKVLGADILTSLDRAIEIYKKVVENAPYGRLADEAQFRMAAAMKKAERYDEAIQAFQKILDDYPTSTFVDKAKYEVADCAYKASLKPAYDVEPTTKAIRAFEDFSRENRDSSLTGQADKTVQRLKDRIAEKSLMTAQFYEKQGRYKAAIIYYQDIINTYPESSFVGMARSKVESLTAKLEKPKTKMTPFKLSAPAKPKAAAPEQAQAAKPKKPALWNPFAKSQKPKEASAPAAQEPKQKKSILQSLFGKRPESERKTKAWTPISFPKSAKPKEPAPAKEQQAVEKKPVLWNPFAKQPKSDTEHKAWTPLNFTRAAKPADEGAPVEPSQHAGKAPSKSILRSLFGKRPETAAAVVEEAKEPQAAETATVTVETPSTDSAREEVTIPAPADEEPSQIKVTTDESEVSAPEPKIAENRDGGSELSEYDASLDKIELSEEY